MPQRTLPKSPLLADTPVMGTVRPPSPTTMPTCPCADSDPRAIVGPVPSVTVTDPTPPVPAIPVTATIASPSIVTEPTDAVAETPVTLALALEFTPTLPTDPVAAIPVTDSVTPNWKVINKSPSLSVAKGSSENSSRRTEMRLSLLMS